MESCGSNTNVGVALIRECVCVCVSGKALYIWKEVAVPSAHDNLVYVDHIITNKHSSFTYSQKGRGLSDPTKDNTTMHLGTTLWLDVPTAGPTLKGDQMLSVMWPALLWWSIFSQGLPFSCWWGFWQRRGGMSGSACPDSYTVKHLLSVDENIISLTIQVNHVAP